MKLFLLFFTVYCIKCMCMFCSSKKPVKLPQVKEVSTYQWVPANLFIQINS